MSVQNIIAVYHRADRVDLREGLAAYASYHQTMQNFAASYDADVEIVAAVFSALSPMNDYMGNMRSLKSVLEGVKVGLPVEKIKCTTTHSNRLKAYRLAIGDAGPREVFKGKKTFAFWNNLSRPTCEKYVTVDRHALSIYEGYRVAKPNVPRNRYDGIADCYREAAKILGVIPNQVQAVTWLTWKRINAIVYKSQLDLFQQGNVWQNTLRPEDVKLFA